MNRASSFCAALLSSGLVLSMSPKASAQSLRTPEYKAASTRGLEHLYRLEHDEAVRFFQELEETYPEHPGPPIAGAIAIWLRELFARADLDLNRFISPGYFTRPAEEEMPEEDREAFFAGIEKSRERATRYLEAHPGDADARYYLGSCEGALGAFAFTIDRSFKRALSHGKASYEIQRSVIEDHPDFHDSYMTVGTYEYVVGNLPWYIKWIATIAGYHGSEERGFRYLIRAAEKGYFVSDDARVLLMVLYVREKQYDYALEVARQLHRRYPENFILHLNQAQILERMGRREAAAGVYSEIVRLADLGTKNYQKMPLGTIRYPLGQRLLALGDAEEALARFKEAAEDPETPEREKALSHLRAGEILDAMGRRHEAVAHYEAVQKYDEYDGSHDAALEYLKAPYRPRE